MDNNMKTVKATFFKESGKYYTEEDIQVPGNLTQMFEINEYLQDNYHEYKGMHMVLMLDEYENGFPIMIPASKRR